MKNGFLSKFIGLVLFIIITAACLAIAITVLLPLFILLFFFAIISEINKPYRRY